MNSKRFFAAAFALGLLALAWIGQGFVGSGNWVALAMSSVILATYLVGAWELRQFRADSLALSAALDGAATQAPTALPEWLDRVPAGLRNAVRLRVDGERGALPGPTLTPYLAGLLVMLGMLGTFLGMVVTFQGAVFALQGSTDLQAIRAALAEPIRGLGLSFGTSIAGVATSAMLGLMSAIARRERLDVSRALDQRIATTLRPFSFAHQREETFRALQAQASALPAVAKQLEALLDRIERRGQQLDEQLLAGQARFHSEASQSYEQLARSVGTSLQDSLVAAATAAGDSIRPVVASAMDKVAQESQRQNAQLAEASRAQVDSLAASFRETSGALVASLGDTAAAAQRAQAERDRERLQAWTQSLDALGARLDAQWQRLAQDTVQQMAALGGALEAPVQRLLQTASEVPAAAAGVLARLQEEVGRGAERDKLALQERTLLLEKLGTVLQEVQQAAGAQRDAIDGMVQSTTAVLQQSGAQFARLLEAQAGRTGEVVAQLADSSAQSVASAMDRMAQESQRQNAQLADSARAQVDALAASFRETSGALVASIGETVAAAQEAQAGRERERLQAWAQSLEALGARLDAQWQRLAQDTVQQMAALGGAMEAPVQRLLQTASEVPAAAAGVLARLQEEVGRTADRDNIALQERALLLEKLGTVLQEVQQASGAQRDAIDGLVQSTTAVLQQSSTQFAQLLEAQAGRAGEAATQLADSSARMGTLAQTFGEGVQQFEASNLRVLQSLDLLHAALQRSLERSDEQLAYYVAQAREVIDLSIASQADVVSAWRQLQGKAKAAPLADEAVG